MNYFFNFDKLDYVKGKKPKGCILCLIKENSKEITDLTVFQNNLFIATVNLYPYNPGHLMIFPKRHLEDIRQFTEEESIELIKLEKYLLNILDKTHSPAGYNIGYNMGRPAGASINHLHLHIIPRYLHETGMADIIAGKRLLVESPIDTASKIKIAIKDLPF